MVSVESDLLLSSSFTGLMENHCFLWETREGQAGGDANMQEGHWGLCHDAVKGSSLSWLDKREGHTEAGTFGISERSKSFGAG